jgi:2-polyprenyl-3-methyl-5-hydroxy-6-metoxy-1,4-benzoquinol methylase
MINQKKLNKIFENYTEEKGFEFKLLKYKTFEVVKFCTGGNVLDLGCGVGILTSKLSKNCNQVTGLDGSDVKIKIAKKYHTAPNIEYVCCMLDEFKPQIKYDSVIMTNFLEHLEKPVKTLKMVSKWMNSGGRIIITIPNAAAFHKRLGMEMGLIDDYFKLTKADQEKGHFKNYDMNLLKKEIENAGFQTLHIGGIFFKPLSSKQMEKFDDSLIEGFYQMGKYFPDLCSGLIIVGEKS